MAVAVKISDGDSLGLPSRGVIHPRALVEGSVSSAEEHGNRVTHRVGYGEIEVPVAVEISDRDPLGSSAGGVVNLSLESAVPVTNQYTHGAAGGVRYDEIGYAVAVQVAGGYSLRIYAGCKLRCFKKLPNLGCQNTGKKKHGEGKGKSERTPRHGAS